MTYYTVLKDHMEINRLYDFQELTDIIYKNYESRSTYVSKYVGGGDNTRYICKALSKLINDGVVRREVIPTVRNKYKGHYFEKVIVT